MVGNGYLIALTRDLAKRVFAQKDDENLRQLLDELRTDKGLKQSGRILELGTLWDPLHRCLTEGELNPEAGEPPLNLAVLGGKQLHQGDDYAAGLVRPDMTNYVAEALAEIKEEDFRTKFFGLSGSSYRLPLDEKLFMQVWLALRSVRVFYEAAAENLEAVVFTGKYAP